MQPSYRLYLREINNYLNSIVIKFEPFVDLLNHHPDHYGNYDPDDPSTFPYYRMLAGDATLASTQIMGWVPSQQQELPLTLDNLVSYPDMRSFYNQEDQLTDLLARYPNDQFLIRRILNPVADINAAIQAKNLALLPTKYKSSYLNSYEQEDLTSFLEYYLERFDYRWYITVSYTHLTLPTKRIV